MRNIELGEKLRNRRKELEALELEKLDNELEALEQDIDEKIEFIHQLLTKYSSIVKITPKEPKC